MTRLARLRDVFLADREPEAALFCTYGFDARFFELEIIPALFPKSLALDRESGSQNAYLNAADVALARPEVSVFYDHVLNDGPELIYETWPVNVAPRAFHPKLMALDYGDVIRVVVGSANLTRPAWTGLLEMFVVEDLIPGAKHPWAEGLQQFVSHLAARIPAGQTHRRAELLTKLGSVRGTAGDSRLVSSWDTALINAALDGVKNASRVDVVTPFFEGVDGEGVFDELERRLGPVKGHLYTSTNDADGTPQVSGPPEKLHALTAEKGWKLHSVDKVWSGDEQGAPLRSLHGKLLGVTHEGGVRIVMGSANVTRAALLHKAPAGNVELVVVQDAKASDLKDALPQATMLGRDEVEFVDVGDPSGEDEGGQPGAERFVLEATYTAATSRLALTLSNDAPALAVRYADHELSGELSARSWHAVLQLAAPRFVTVDDGAGPAIVPFIILDPQCLTPRGNAAAVGLEAFCELLAGTREPATPADGDSHERGPGDTPPRTEDVGTRGAIPWRRYLAAVAGLGRECERECQMTRGLLFTIQNPTRLAGLLKRLDQAHNDRHFTTADLLYALYELERELRRVRALEMPKSSRVLLDSEITTLAARRAALLATASERLVDQFGVLKAMDGV